MYVLGVEPLEGDRDGKPHEVRINVKVPGVQVRARREFVAPPLPKTASASPIALALASPWVATGLSLGISTRTVSVEPTGGLRVLVTAEVGKDIPSAAEFTVGLVVKDAQGRQVIASPPETARLLVPRGSPKNSASYVATLALPPGDYHLRLAATDAEGRVGSVDHPFSAALAQGDGVMMADLVLLHPGRSADDPLALISDGRMPIGKLAAHLEVLAPAEGSAPTVMFGVADRVDGPLLVKAAATVGKSSVKGQSAADGLLDLSLLPPGKYTAVAIVTNGTHKVGTRSQPLYLDRPAATGGHGGCRLRRNLGRRPTRALRSEPFVHAGEEVHPGRRGHPGGADLLREPADGGGHESSCRRRVGIDGSPRFPVRRGPGWPEPHAVGWAVGGVREGGGAAGEGPGSAGGGRVPTRHCASPTTSCPPPSTWARATPRRARTRWPWARGRRHSPNEGEARIVYDVLADALLRLEDPEQALQVLEEARGRWPEDDGFLTRQAVADAMLGRRAEAAGHARSGTWTSTGRTPRPPRSRSG